MKKLLVLATLALMAAGCASGATPSIPGTLVGVGERTLSISVTGASTYSATAPVVAGALKVGYTGSNTIDVINGSGSYSNGVESGTFAVALTAFGMSFNGSVVVTPTATPGFAVSVSGASLAIDGDGDFTVVSSSGGVTLSFGVTTVNAPGVEPILDTLSALENDFCAKAQQTLAGLDPLQVPLGAITNNLYDNRSAFGGSKAVLAPLTVQTWQEAGEFDTAAGNNLAITDDISCKTRSADHLATLALTTAPDLQCKVLNQASLAAALNELTPTELATYNASPNTLSFGVDSVKQSGVEWLSPYQPVQAGAGPAGTTLVTSQSLLVNWTDPNFILFPDTIRGVHYCTVKSPAWFYVYASTV